MDSETMKMMDDALERMIDCNSLCEVLERLVSICEEKADHVRSNWQDTVLANAWRKAARVLDTANSRLGDL